MGIGPIEGAEGVFTVQERIDRQLPVVARVSLRALLRASFLELYLDDVLLQCVSLPAPASGNLKLLAPGTTSPWTDVTLWRMQTGDEDSSMGLPAV